MRIKRFGVTLVVMGLLAASCGGDGDDGGGGTGEGGEGGGDEKVRVALLLPNTRNDFTWNQQAYEGAIEAEKQGAFDLTWVDNVGDDAAGFIPVAEQYAQQGYDLIIAHTFNYGEPVLRLAPQYPDVNWAWAGSGIPEDTLENVADYAQPFYEGSYLAGILMAGASQTGKIGGIAGFDIPACHSMMEGFREGAKLVNPEIEMEVTYLGTWFDPAKEKEAALALYDAGADIIGVCGTPTGVIEAASERNLGVIGYVHDQASAAPENVLTSVVWNTSVLWTAMAEDVAAGTFRPGSVYFIGVKDNGILVEPNPQYKDPISDEALQIYENTLAGMQDGSIEAPYIPE